MKTPSIANRFMAHWIAAKRKKDHGSRASYSTRKLAPMVEMVENRQLLCYGPFNPGAGFIAGTAFIDQNCDGKLGADDDYLPNATIQLFKAGQSNPIRETRTDSYGAYTFDGLAPGDYVVKQLATCDTKVTSTEILSDLNPASAGSGNTIKVSVVDPNAVYNTYQGIQPGKYAVADVKINQGESKPNAFGPMTISLGTTKGGDDLAEDLITFCVNDLQSVSFGGGESWKVKPSPAVGITGSAATAGRIGYLFNHYANSSLTNVSGPALQLAIWELIYDGDANPNFSAGDFQLTSPISTVDGADPNAILAQARQFYLESAGKREAVTFLKTATCDLDGQQSMLARGSFNFGNSKTCVEIEDRCGSVKFWTGCNGQKLIKCFDGGERSCRLGDWLSKCYPNLYGRGQGCKNTFDFCGKSNREIADCISKYAKDSRYCNELDLLATALSQYASTRSLGGRDGCDYGFKVSDGGLGSIRVNVACTGDAFKVGNCSVQSISDLLRSADRASCNGRAYDSNGSHGAKAGSLFSFLTRSGSVDRDCR